MISFVKGVVVRILDSAIIVECGGIGYHINVTNRTVSKLSVNDKIQINTYMQVREDAITLFGFLTNEEIEAFNLLISVRGLGSKTAASVLDVLTPSKIMLAIVSDDYKTLTTAPGVGKKTAQRIILDLKDKVKTYDAVAGMASENQESIHVSDGSNAKRDAVDALVALGYSKSEAVKAVMETAVEGMEAEQIIKSSLRKLI